MVATMHACMLDCVVVRLKNTYCMWYVAMDVLHTVDVWLCRCRVVSMVVWFYFSQDAFTCIMSISWFLGGMDVRDGGN